jgi:putative hydrolase of the HAD superfamily
MDLPASACVFVDDLAHNITAAADLGLVGVRHVTYEETLTELETLFGIDLA